MKPYVICHMNTSIDGRTWGSRWLPAENLMAGLFERIHEQLGNGSWLIGRITGSEYAKAAAYPDRPGEFFPREPWFVRRDAAAYGIALDAHGKIAWGRADIGGDPIVVILTKQVSDAHLAGLRRDGVSYIFAGERKLDLALALEILNRELGIERLLLEGGGKSNGSFLLAGLIDEISLAVCPAVDGARGGPYAFDSHDDETDARAPLRSMTLESCGLTIDNLFVGLRPEAPNGGGPSAPFRIPVGVGGKETAPPDLQPDSFGCVPLRFVFGGLLRF
jgi:riboflavin biosynthesis pyrimidine reductase